MGSVTDFLDLSALYDDSLSLNKGALRIPGYSMDGWYGRIFRGAGSSTRTSRSATTPRRNCTTCSTRSRRRSRSRINLTYAGLIPTIQKSFLSKDKEAMQPHIRAFVERAVTFTAWPRVRCTSGSTRRPGRRRSRGRTSPKSASMQTKTRPNGSRGLDELSVRCCWPRCGRPSTCSWRSGRATSRSTGRRARCRAARRSASR